MSSHAAAVAATNAANAAASAAGRRCTCQGDAELGGVGIGFGCRLSKGFHAGPSVPLAADTPQPERQRVCSSLLSLAESTGKLLHDHLPGCYDAHMAGFETGQECRLPGPHSSAYAGCEINLDHTTHPHIDHNDIAGGAAGMLVLSRPGDQSHFLLPEYAKALRLPNGSALFQAAREEMHCNSPQPFPCRLDPARVSIVFYLHSGLAKSHHGRACPTPFSCDCLTRASAINDDRDTELDHA